MTLLSGKHVQLRRVEPDFFGVRLERADGVGHIAIDGAERLVEREVPLDVLQIVDPGRPLIVLSEASG